MCTFTNEEATEAEVNARAQARGLRLIPEMGWSPNTVFWRLLDGEDRVLAQGSLETIMRNPRMEEEE
jgi:hypothetical protein